jgi:hypothetical protein
VCDGRTFQSHADYSLYDGWTLKAWPVLTMLRGQVIMENGRVVAQPGYGRYLARTVRPRVAGTPPLAAGARGAR